MVEIVLAVAVFILAVAVVGLFAMMGELASRVPAPDDTPDTAPAPVPFQGAILGAEAPVWPDGIAHLREAPHAVLIVLSTVCETCRRIADGTTGPLRIPATAAGVVISCPRPGRGEEFVAEFPALRAYPTALDIEGAWSTGNFGVDISPSVLVFEQGRLRSAHTFVAAGALDHLPTTHDHAEEDVHAGKSASV